jgi:hypothetical protein
MHTDIIMHAFAYVVLAPPLSWSYNSWILNYISNQCVSPLTLWVRIPLRRCVLDTALCNKICQWLATVRRFSPVSSTNKTDRHDIVEILLKVALNTTTITLTLTLRCIALLHFTIGLGFGNCNYILSVSTATRCMLT